MVKIVTHSPYRIRRTSAAAEKGLSGATTSVNGQKIVHPAQKQPAKKQASRTIPARVVKSSQ